MNGIICVKMIRNISIFALRYKLNGLKMATQVSTDINRLINSNFVDFFLVHEKILCEIWWQSTQTFHLWQIDTVYQGRFFTRKNQLHLTPYVVQYYNEIHISENGIHVVALEFFFLKWWRHRQHVIMITSIFQLLLWRSSYAVPMNKIQLNKSTNLGKY